MTPHKHPPIIQLAAQQLQRHGVLRTYDAVYSWTCPDCGAPQRTTRLADTVYALRHAYGWQINTLVETGNVAVYTLGREGDMPGDESNGPHPRRLVRDLRDVAHDFAKANNLPISSALTKPQGEGYAPYHGQRVPIEAIPDGDRVECPVCGWKPKPDQIEDRTVMLGGWVTGICRSCSTGKTIVRRVFKPVRRGKEQQHE